MKPSLPLLELGDPAAPLFLRRGQAISRGQFAAAAVELARQLPHGAYALNLCKDRQAFALAFAATVLRGQTGLLPPSTAPAFLQSLAAAYPGAAILSEDAAAGAIAVSKAATAASRRRLARIPAAHPAAVAFTSGSTGQPLPQVKTWHALQHIGAVLSQRLLAGLERCSIVATVPAQHMYGLETSIVLPLVGGHCVWAGQPGFPDDVRSALAEVPAPRLLVTTPVHIRALLAAGVRLPPLACLVSATAPLPPELAQRAEAAFAAPVMEIYGCSEAGSIGTRRPVEDDRWQPLPGIELLQEGGVTLVRGIHLPAPVPLQDILQPCEGGFRLFGRAADLVKVAGKRASLADLTQKLLSIPGVLDGVVFQPADDDAGAVQRPAALVVAPALSEAEILRELGRLVDPVFLPRPLRKIDGLPRNDVGKLPRASLQRLL